MIPVIVLAGADWRQFGEMRAELWLYIIMSCLLSSCTLKITKSARRGLSKVDSNTASVVYDDDDLGSLGVQRTVKFFNEEETGKEIALKLVKSKVVDSLKSTTFWGTDSGTIESVTCLGLREDGVVFKVKISRNGIDEQALVTLPFGEGEVPADETDLKIALCSMVAERIGRYLTPSVAALEFGDDISLPSDFQFNKIPHSTWVRAYLYDRVSTAVLQAVEDETIRNKARLQIIVNFPELNPKFDTYRLGTLAELVRETALRLCEGGLKVRLVVQQSLGEGIFSGTPLALSSMMPVLQKMDWGTSLTKDQLYQEGDMTTPRKEAYVRLGRVGAEQVAEDDDVIIILSPQNVQGGEVITLLDEMCVQAQSQGTTVILINPSLGDRPSGNNKMQIRGRAERRAVQDSFQNIFQLKLLYPSSGGYMYPIAGLVSKKNYRAPYVAYKIVKDQQGRETYACVGVWAPSEPPSRSALSDLFV